MSKKKNKPQKAKRMKNAFPNRFGSALKFKPSQQIQHIEYEITTEPIRNNEYEKLPQNVKQKMEDLYDLISKNPHEAIAELTALKEEYPQIPQIYNYLSSAYSQMGDKKNFEAAMMECYEKHPNYLFGKIQYAEYCISKGEIDKVPKIFDNKFELKLLYPQRTVFHITEVITFAGMIGYYWVRAGNRQVAEVYYKMLKQIAPDHMATIRLQRELHPSYVYRILKSLLEKIDPQRLDNK